MLIRNLIITFKYLFQFIIRYLSGINNFYLYSLYSILPDTISKFTLIRPPAGVYFKAFDIRLVNILSILSSSIQAMKLPSNAVGYHCNRLTFSINTEYICQLFQKHNNLSRTYLEFQRIIFQFIKIKHLVYQPQHTVYTTLYDTKQILFSPVISGLLQ